MKRALIGMLTLGIVCAFTPGLMSADKECPIAAAKAAKAAKICPVTGKVIAAGDNCPLTGKATVQTVAAAGAKSCQKANAQTVALVGAKDCQKSNAKTVAAAGAKGCQKAP